MYIGFSKSMICVKIVRSRTFRQRCRVISPSPLDVHIVVTIYPISRDNLPSCNVSWVYFIRFGDIIFHDAQPRCALTEYTVNPL